MSQATQTVLRNKIKGFVPKLIKGNRKTLSALEAALREQSVEMQAMAELIASEINAPVKAKKRGRPAGSKNVVKARGRGRPAGSKNKVKAKSRSAAAKVVKAKKGKPGRPKGMTFPNGYGNPPVMVKAATKTVKVKAKKGRAAKVVKTKKKGKPGRPKGLKFPNGYKKHKETAVKTVKTTTGKKRGRPAGSKNKVEAPAAPVAAPAAPPPAAVAELDAILK